METKTNKNKTQGLQFDLVKRNHTWLRILRNGEQSKESTPTLLHSMEQILKDDPEDWTWKVKSSIQFRYTVEKVADSFAFESTAILASPMDVPENCQSENLPPGFVSNKNFNLNQQRLQGNANEKKRLRRMVFVDETVFANFRQKIVSYFSHHNVDVTILEMDVAEETKSVASLLRILESIDRQGLDRRNEPIIVIGGGVLMDLVGLAATLYRRRTPYIRVPTTLLGLVDASVGGKTGVNFCNGKNKLGAYVPPFKVIIDSTFLETLPHRHICNGLGEILKMALVKSKKLFDILETYGEEMIQNKFQSKEADVSIRIAIETMLEELAPNMWEDDLDRLVDFGHVISPALEMEVLPTLLHGEAVNIDMAFNCVLSHVMGYLSLDCLLRIFRVMKSLELPTYHPKCNLELIEKALQGRLKHSNGSLRLPIPYWIGKAMILNSASPNLIRQAESTWRTMSEGNSKTLKDQANVAKKLKESGVLMSG